jgi:hypothetical protein
LAFKTVLLSQIAMLAALSESGLRAWFSGRSRNGLHPKIIMLFREGESWWSRRKDLHKNALA